MQTQFAQNLAELGGTHATPKQLANEDVSLESLKHGQQIYHKHCVQCHGVSGDGNGPVGAFMYPRPRDYRKGIFKFTSTPYGSRPLRTDLILTVNRGIQGTSMPAFKLLPEEEVAAVVDYVLALAQRGELEEQFITKYSDAVEFEEQVNPEDLRSEAVPTVVNRWVEAQGSEVSPLTSQPVFTMEHVARGKEAFLSDKWNCLKCHGADGRGQTKDNLAGNLKDAWGNPTRAADLTSGILHGGQRPIDIYRRIYSGINGTPMPAFANALKEDPDTAWDLVAFVMHITNARRAGERPSAGPISPYVPVAAAEAPGDTNAETAE